MNKLKKMLNYYFKSNCVTYWVRKPEHTDIYEEGYVGIAYDFEDRMRGHSKDDSKDHFHNAVRKYGWDSLDKSIQKEGSRFYCQLWEWIYRPTGNTNKTWWNTRMGGEWGRVARLLFGMDYSYELSDEAKENLGEAQKIEEIIEIINMVTLEEDRGRPSDLSEKWADMSKGKRTKKRNGGTRPQSSHRMNDLRLWTKRPDQTRKDYVSEKVDNIGRANVHLWVLKEDWEANKENKIAEARNYKKYKKLYEDGKWAPKPYKPWKEWENK